MCMFSLRRPLTLYTWLAIKESGEIFGFQQEKRGKGSQAKGKSIKICRRRKENFVHEGLAFYVCFFCLYFPAMFPLTPVVRCHLPHEAPLISCSLNESLSKVKTFLPLLRNEPFSTSLIIELFIQPNH